MAPIPDRSGVAYDSEAQASCFRVSPKKNKKLNALLQPVVSRRTARSVREWSVGGQFNFEKRRFPSHETPGMRAFYRDSSSEVYHPYSLLRALSTC